MTCSVPKMQYGWPGDGGFGERMVQQILSGVKTATCDLICFCSPAEVTEAFQSIGQIATLADSSGQPRGAVRITAVYRTTFGSPDRRLVRGEGYGDDVDAFQRGHERFFRPFLEQAGMPPISFDAELLVWEFELINAGI